MGREKGDGRRKGKGDRGRGGKGRAMKGVEKDARGGKGRGEKMGGRGSTISEKRPFPVIRWLITGLYTLFW